MIMTLCTIMKPTCLIQMSSRILAIATGSLKEPSQIEIHDVYRDENNQVLSLLKSHKDMIDSMLKITFPFEKLKSSNPYIQWLLSAGRDR